MQQVRVHWVIDILYTLTMKLHVWFLGILEKINFDVSFTLFIDDMMYFIQYWLLVCGSETPQN